MKKQFLCGILALTMTAALFTGCGKDGDKSGSKTFTVGFDAEYPPYGYMDDNGDYTGFDLELAQAVCDLKGWKLKKQPIVWDNKDNELNSGSIDCIWNGFTMNGREDSYTWSDAYVDNSQVIVTKKSADITKLTDLKGKVVGVPHSMYWKAPRMVVRRHWQILLRHCRSLPITTRLLWNWKQALSMRSPWISVLHSTRSNPAAMTNTSFWMNT